MKCDNCGKEMNFLLAYKVKGHSGHFCSKHCAHEATWSEEYERGGILELIVAIFMLIFWICKWIIKGTIWIIKKVVEIIKNQKAKKSAAAPADPAQ